MEPPIVLELLYKRLDALEKRVAALEKAEADRKAKALASWRMSKGKPTSPKMPTMSEYEKQREQFG